MGPAERHVDEPAHEAYQTIELAGIRTADAIMGLPAKHRMANSTDLDANATHGTSAETSFRNNHVTGTHVIN